MSTNPLLGYFGHHKCGTTWIQGILADVARLAGLTIRAHHYENLFDGDILALREKEPFDLWCYSNADFNFVRDIDVRGFHVVRDPRDMIVSAYFSHRYSHADGSWPRLRHYRPYLRTLSKDDGLIKEMEFNAIFLHQMLMWDYDTPNILQLRFEDLVAQPYLTFRSILEFLALVPAQISANDLQAVVDDHSFVRLSGGRRRGEEDTGHHYRKGVPGDWRHHFTRRHIDYFNALYSPLLEKLGYH
jgi:hypothetical protein